MDKVMELYKHLHGPLESLLELHKIPSIGTLGETRTKKEFKQEIQAFLEPIRQDATRDDLEVTKEVITQYVVEPMRLYTKLMTLSNKI